MEIKIHRSTVNNKGAKINIGGMGIRGNKETKAYEMFRVMGRDFEMMEREYYE